MLDLAKRGAEARYRELVAELKMLAQAFPHLRDSFDRDELPVNFILRVGRDKAAAAPTRRRQMSAKGRAAISAAQKARWKRQKAAAKKR
jgi:hypothetical protein